MMTSRNFGDLTTPASPLGVPTRMGVRGMPRMRSTKRGRGVPSMGGLSLLKLASGGFISDSEDPSMGQVMTQQTMRSSPNMALYEYLAQRMDDGGEVEAYRPRGGLTAARRAARKNYLWGPRLNARSERMPEEEAFQMFDLDSPMRAARFRWRPEMGPSMRDRQSDALFDMANAPVARRQQEYEDWREGGLGEFAVELASDPLTYFGPGSIFKAVKGLKPNIAIMGGYSALPQEVAGIREVGSMGERLPFMQDVWRAPRDFRLIGD